MDRDLPCKHKSKKSGCQLFQYRNSLEDIKVVGGYGVVANLKQKQWCQEQAGQLQWQIWY